MMIAAEGCIAGALSWFGRALRNISRIRSRQNGYNAFIHKTGAVRALAVQEIELRARAEIGINRSGP